MFLPSWMGRDGRDLNTHNSSQIYSSNTSPKIDSADQPESSSLTDDQLLQQQELVAALIETLHQQPSSAAVAGEDVPAFLLTSNDSSECVNDDDDESTTNNSESYKNFLICPCCPYAAADRDDLDVHALGEHQENCVFTCQQCENFSSDRWGKYSRHIAKHILADKTYTCPMCSYRSKTKGSYDAHMRTHTGEKPYACSFCPYRSSQRVHLKIHVRTHTGEKPFACPNCPYQATQNSSLKRHIQTQHPVTPRISRRYNKYALVTQSASPASSSTAQLQVGTQQLSVSTQLQESLAMQQHLRQLLQQQLQQFLASAAVTRTTAISTGGELMLQLNSSGGIADPAQEKHCQALTTHKSVHHSKSGKIVTSCKFNKTNSVNLGQSSPSYAEN